jgi:mannose-6-phosphate isomerase-like protein (cupin superfamily)
VLGWIGDIERARLENETFRTVVYTGGHIQLTVMRLGPGQDIGREAHPHLDQFLRIESGSVASSSAGPRTRSRRRTTSRTTGRSSFRRACDTTW